MLKGDPAISGGDPVSVLPPLASLHCNPVIADREEVVITLTRLDPNEISFLTSSRNSECPEKAARGASCPPRFRKTTQPGIKRSGVGSSHGIQSGILAMPFPRAARERRLSNIDGGGPEKGKKENKRCLHAFPARRLDQKGGGQRDRDEGCPRVRVYKDRPPPSSTFHPRETTAFGYLLNYYDRMQRRGTTIHRRRNTSLLSHQLSRVDGVRSCTRGPPPRSCPSLSPWKKRLYCI
ncbi:hypothetical protein ALC57_17502 [Trachymyrmex cornetzi]|uniref:Uncharacterized protein n=1 Tax=Trachymyrmex cornetzi TaxID=471704 RepID=A0A195DBL5_9HYME|nr:hypothetical protein ALC57_17502 [Trachymyrmex cornetzi]